jgi:hypothetical protein
MACDSVVNMFQGEKRLANFTITDSTNDQPVDLTGISEITISVPQVNSGIVSFTKTLLEIVVTDALKGKFQLTMSSAKTALFKAGTLTIQVNLDFGASDIRVQQIAGAFIVSKQLV